ncbi:uncharacterized protein LOC100575717 [Acyrthosiphon pisum]|uniref:Uncharacterized protein n=1 Tax=Acyrthosiphon pisum TaxID=7029 RepID=A0A8R2AA34_ACYPI|nr:uncharacterized protein LOC100575717 [Acyrthosiphon pisum]|eukprot:XP_003241713.1 PREDICTED: uncharacterized protein LOC100575717 [Acyrthosiphon pisum]
MKIRCNHVISAAIFVVFVVTSVNARNVRQNLGTSIDTTGMTTIKVYETVNNTTAMKPINGTANNATATSSIEGTAATQAVTIANVGTATETQTDENGLLVDKNVIIHPLRKPDGGQCPRGYSITSNGNCKPSFTG